MIRATAMDLDGWESYSGRNGISPGITSGDTTCSSARSCGDAGDCVAANADVLDLSAARASASGDGLRGVGPLWDISISGRSREVPGYDGAWALYSWQNITTAGILLAWTIGLRAGWEETPLEVIMPKPGSAACGLG